MKSFFKNNSIQLMMVLLAVCYIATTIFHPLQQDEGVFLTIGQNMNKGLVPYRDLFDHKPPGIYFLFSFLYRFLDNHIVWYKIVLIITNLISTWLVCQIAIWLSLEGKKQSECSFKEIATPSHKGEWLAMTNRKTSNLTIQQFNNLLWAPVFFLWLILVFEGQYLIAEPLMAFFLLLGTYLYLNFCHCEQGRRSNLIAQSKIDCRASRRIGMARNDSDQLKRIILRVMTGISFGLALLFKQTAVLSIIAFIFYLIWQKQRKQLALLLLGAAVPTIATITYLWQNNILTDAYRQIILYNFQYYPSENIFKVINLLAVPFLYTLPVWLLSIYGVFRLSRKGRPPIGRLHSPLSFCRVPNRVPQWTYIPTVLLALLPMLGYFGRHYPHYWLQSTPFVAILAANALNDAVGKFRKNLIAPSLSPKADLAGHCLIFGSKSGNKESYFFQHRAQALACFIVISASIFSYNFLRINYPKYHAEQQLIKFLRQNDSAVFAENQFVGVYFLAQKAPLNRYLYLTEINDWSEQSEQRTIEQAKKNQPLIIWPTDSNYAYAKELQRYIFANYKPIFWQYDLGVVVYKTQTDN